MRGGAHLARARADLEPAPEGPDADPAGGAGRPAYAPPLPTALYFAPFGGEHTASDDTGSAPPPLGFTGLVFCVDYPIASSPWAVGFRGQLGFATEDPDRALADLLGGMRLAHHVPVGKKTAVGPWGSVALGLAGYDVNSFGFNGQVGIDAMRYVARRQERPLRETGEEGAHPAGCRTTARTKKKTIGRPSHLLEEVRWSGAPKTPSTMRQRTHASRARRRARTASASRWAQGEPERGLTGARESEGHMRARKSGNGWLRLRTRSSHGGPC